MLASDSSLDGLGVDIGDVASVHVHRTIVTYWNCWIVYARYEGNVTYFR